MTFALKLPDIGGNAALKRNGQHALACLAPA